MIRLPVRTLFALVLFATGASARTLEVGAGKEFKMPSDAVKAARDGDRVAIYPGEYFDCATVDQKGLTIDRLEAVPLLGLHQTGVLFGLHSLSERSHLPIRKELFVAGRQEAVPATQP